MKEINSYKGSSVYSYMVSSRKVKKMLPVIESVKTFSRPEYEKELFRNRSHVSLNFLLRNELVKVVNVTPVRTSKVYEIIMVDARTESRICSLKEWELMGESIKKIFGDNVRAERISRNVSWGKRNTYEFDMEGIKAWLTVNNENARRYHLAKLENLEDERAKCMKEISECNEDF